MDKEKLECLIAYHRSSRLTQQLHLFTKFKVRWGYNNIHIKEGDEWKATFLTHEGLFELTVMFFGLTNSPVMFQMIINTIFHQEVALGWLLVLSPPMQ
jgi:hypothetical protein